MDIDAIMRGISIWAIPVVLAIVLHEVAHGWVADRLGDSTARMLGRLTLNPIKHIDPVGTILMPLLLLVFQSPFLFGYAKPVPVNFKNLRRPRKDMVLVALAGPMTNLVLAFLSAMLIAMVLKLPDDMRWLVEPVALMAQASILINLVLFFFNLLPLPPLDGGRVAVGLLPGPLAYQLSRLEPYGFLIVVGLLMLGVFQQILFPLVMDTQNILLGMFSVV